MGQDYTVNEHIELLNERIRQKSININISKNNPALWEDLHGIGNPIGEFLLK